MNEPENKGMSRRTLAAGGGVAVALGLTALAVTAPLIWQGYPHTEYDDLLARLVDREQAIRVGRAVLRGGSSPEPKALARMLRQRFEARSTSAVIASDLAAGHLREVQGWVLPESLALLCLLAADAS